MLDPLVERYLRLGLQVGRHVDGVVDAYYGPPELRAEVEAEPLVDPRELAAAAERLCDELEDGWLRDQAAALQTYCRVLAGDEISYADEVEACYGVRPAHTDEEVFAGTHARLEELLPGEGTLAERYERWRQSMDVPVERTEAAVAAAIEEARAQTRRFVDLPEGEDIALEIVHDKPWRAFCTYLGGLQSRIDVNVDLPLGAIGLLHLAIHETYPGHHAERCLKEHGLVRGRGALEETLVLLPAPQSLVSEGIAELATELLLEGEGGEALADVVRRAGIELDLDHALAVDRAHQPCEWAHVNAALMLHDGAGEEEVRAYLERWALMTPELSAHAMRFLGDPASRSYVITYAAGRALCRAYVGGDLQRFAHLLSEQVRVSELQANARS